MRFLAGYLLLLLVVLLAGCDSLTPPSLDREIVVESYLVAGEPLASVRLTHTVPLDEVFDADSLGVRGADVRVELLGSNGELEETYVLPPVPEQPGIYRSDASPIVRPLRSYRLVVRTADGDGSITSVTTVPDTIRVLSTSSDTVVYRSQDPFTFYVSPPAYPGRQSVFLLTTVALEASVAQLTPLARALFDDGDVSIAELSESASPLLNEENFDQDGGGSLRIQYPWLGLNFYGRSRVVVQTLDDNLHDFVRSQSVQQGGSTLPPGEIPNVLENVDGGRGIFGSLARASVEFVVLRGAD